MPKDLFVSALLDVYGEFLSKKQRDLISLYYDEDLSLAEIAENEDITRQGVSDAINRAKSRLYKLEESYGYCKKFLRLKELKENISDAESAKEICDIIDNL
ncbi:MAG: DNA-binding protein [Clostridia bacterium]|nr:DNA-binding protein [Clostridia bacterium]